jgi:hypothetical protein
MSIYNDESNHRDADLFGERLWWLMKFIGVLAVIYLVVSLFTGCAARTGNVWESPSHFGDVDIEAEWKLAQEDVSRLDPPPPGNPWDVTHDMFRFVIEGETFACSREERNVVGCFVFFHEQLAIRGLIRYVEVPGVIRHEARHAILRVLNDERAPYIGH